MERREEEKKCPVERNVETITFFRFTVYAYDIYSAPGIVFH